jgi:hydrogenase expression/formation protein HypD
MKYVDEFRHPKPVRELAEAIRAKATGPWTIMEVCGGQTHTIVKYGLHALLPETVRLIHGPGCPVCVTPVPIIDHALHIASLPGTILCSFGDMLRVPGTRTDLLTMKAKGHDVRTVNSPLEAVKLAEDDPGKQVVFFAVGFETTAPPNAMAAYLAKQKGLRNFSLLVSHVLVPPALDYLMRSPDNEVQGFLAAGHVCTVTGYHAYHSLAEEHRAPIIITGFEPVDILQGIYMCLNQLECHTHRVENQYIRCVKELGNSPAQQILSEVFKVVDREWRGIGIIPASGFGLNDAYLDYDAAARFPLGAYRPAEDNGCISGLVLQGKKTPCQCPLFGKQCRPENPIGAPMVSNEGACAVYYQYARRNHAQ